MWGDAVFQKTGCGRESQGEKGTHEACGKLAPPSSKTVCPSIDGVRRLMAIIHIINRMMIRGMRIMLKRIMQTKLMMGVQEEEKHNMCSMRDTCL